MPLLLKVVGDKSLINLAPSNRSVLFSKANGDSVRKTSLCMLRMRIRLSFF